MTNATPRAILDVYMMHPVSLAAVGNGLSGAAHDAQPPTASSARGESGAVVRLTAAPLWGTHCSGRGGAPVAGLLLGESPGLLGHLTVQGAPIDLHHGVRRWSRRQGSKCAEGGRKGGGAQTHSDRAQLVVVHAQDPCRVHIRQRSPAASHREGPVPRARTANADGSRAVGAFNAWGTHRVASPGVKAFVRSRPPGGSSSLRCETTRNVLLKGRLGH